LHELRVRRLPMAPAAQALCLAAALGLLLYTVQPILAGTGEKLGRQCRQMSFPEMARRFLRTAHDLPRDGDFAAAAGRLMGKYSGGQKFPAYFFGMEGVEVAMYDGRSKAYPYDDPDQALIVRRTVERILSTDPPLRPGDCVYTSSGMHYGKPVLGGKRRLEEALFDRLRSRYALQRVESSGGVTVYRVMGAKGDGGDP
ncbi:MAG TPA: hypothetical protein VFR02_08325, partial [bacterium]|nr:hypothetical protein [bacterium]